VRLADLRGAALALPCTCTCPVRSARSAAHAAATALCVAIVVPCCVHRLLLPGDRGTRPQRAQRATLGAAGADFSAGRGPAPLACRATRGPSLGGAGPYQPGPGSVAGRRAARCDPSRRGVSEPGRRAQGHPTPPRPAGIITRKPLALQAPQLWHWRLGPHGCCCGGSDVSQTARRARLRRRPACRPRLPFPTSACARPRPCRPIRAWHEALTGLASSSARTAGADAPPLAHPFASQAVAYGATARRLCCSHDLRQRASRLRPEPQPRRARVLTVATSRGRRSQQLALSSA
jgi:hypothetical protein